MHIHAAEEYLNKDIDESHSLVFHFVLDAQIAKKTFQLFAFLK